MRHLLRAFLAASVLPGKFRFPKIALASIYFGIYWVRVGILVLLGFVREMPHGANEPEKDTRQSKSRPYTRQSFHKPPKKARQSQKKVHVSQPFADTHRLRLQQRLMALKGIGNPSTEPCTDPFAIHDDPGTEILSDPIRFTYVVFLFFVVFLFCPDPFDPFQGEGHTGTTTYALPRLLTTPS